MKNKKNKTNFNYFRVLLIIIVSFHILLLTKIVFFPYPELFIYPYLTEKGMLPYAQIFDQHFPGLMFFPVNMASLGITTPYKARILHLFVVFVTQVMIFVTAKEVTGNEKKAVLASVLYLIWQPFFEGYVLWIDTLVTPILLASFIFLFRSIKKKETKHLYLSGLFLGLSLLFKQTVAPLIFLVALYILIFYKKPKYLLSFTAGVGFFVLLLFIYIQRLGIWNEFYYWTVTFNLTTFSEMGRKSWDFAGLIKSMPLFGFAIMSLIYLVTKRKEQSVIGLGVFFIGCLAFVYARFDFVHLQPALPFAVLIIVLLIGKVKVKRKYVLGYLTISFLLLFNFYRKNIKEEVYFFGEYEREVALEIKKLTKPGDTVFAMATYLHVYQATDTMPPGRIFVFQFPWFMEVAQKRQLQGIIEDPPKVVIRDENARVQGKRLVFYMRDINDYINENYKIIDKIDDTEILIPK